MCSSINGKQAIAERPFDLEVLPVDEVPLTAVWKVAIMHFCDSLNSLQLFEFKSWQQSTLLRKALLSLFSGDTVLLIKVPFVIDGFGLSRDVVEEARAIVNFRLEA